MTYTALVVLFSVPLCFCKILINLSTDDSFIRIPAFSLDEGATIETEIDFTIRHIGVEGIIDEPVVYGLLLGQRHLRSLLLHGFRYNSDFVDPLFASDVRTYAPISRFSKSEKGQSFKVHYKYTTKRKDIYTLVIINQPILTGPVSQKYGGDLTRREALGERQTAKSVFRVSYLKTLATSFIPWLSLDDEDGLYQYVRKTLSITGTVSFVQPDGTFIQTHLRKFPNVLSFLLSVCTVFIACILMSIYYRQFYLGGGDEHNRAEGDLVATSESSSDNDIQEHDDTTTDHNNIIPHTHSLIRETHSEWNILYSGTRSGYRQTLPGGRRGTDFLGTCVSRLRLFLRILCNLSDFTRYRILCIIAIFAALSCLKAELEYVHSLALENLVIIEGIPPPGFYPPSTRTWSDFTAAIFDILELVIYLLGSFGYSVVRAPVNRRLMITILITAIISGYLVMRTIFSATRIEEDYYDGWRMILHSIGFVIAITGVHFHLAFSQIHIAELPLSQEVVPYYQATKLFSALKYSLMTMVIEPSISLLLRSTLLHWEDTAYIFFIHWMVRITSVCFLAVFFVWDPRGVKSINVVLEGRARQQTVMESRRY